MLLLCMLPRLLHVQLAAATLLLLPPPLLLRLWRASA
jgi:hypothetical protein